MSRCTACDCAKTSQQVVFGIGDVKAKIVSIGEAPGPDEDSKGEPFVGRAGKLHDEFWETVGIKRADLWITNIAKCFPGRTLKGGIATPKETDVQICKDKWLRDELRIVKPLVIVAWGLTAAHGFGIGKKLTMGDIAGKEFETEFGIVIPVYHPSYFLRNPNEYLTRQKVYDALSQAVVRAGIGTKIFGGMDQQKTERHQEDKSVIAALESRSSVFDHVPWPKEGDPNFGRAYSTAWTDGSDIWLIYKDKHNRKKAEVIDWFEWYFYVKTKDFVEKVPASWLSRWKRDGLIHRVEPDSVNPEWLQVFAERHVQRTWALREHLLESYLTLWDDRTIQKYPKDQKLRKMLDELEKMGVNHYEADLTPTRRFMTDYDIKLMEHYDECYIDIETDDTLPLGDRRTLGDRRILSIAWETVWADRSRKPESGFLLLKKENDRAEREMLEEFKYVMAGIDVMYAWNGNNFDFPILRHRSRRYHTEADWETIHTIDLLRTWFRYFQRGAAVNTSYALQSIAKHILKKEKLDWRAMAKQRGQNIKSFLQLYREAPDILEEYNRWDARLLLELEQHMGFAKIDQVFSRIGNCFARDYHITTKIDSLLLKRGKQSGMHFKTKKVKIISEGGKAAYKKEQGWEAYEGAYVLEPKLGVFDNVAALDFKSLYPSVMVAFNISPETHLKEDEVAGLDPSQYISCPVKEENGEFVIDKKRGTKFRTDVLGYVPTIFQDTGEKRKVYQELQANEPVGSDLFLLYYRLAYSFKRLGLSFYGDMGNLESRYFNPKVAEAVTLSGQFILKEALKFAEREGVEPLYGDTDSMYVKLPASEGPGFVKRCNDYLRTLLNSMGVPDERFKVELEYENYFSRMFFLKKKRYAGLMTMYKGKEASFTEVKGLEMMRSDGIEYTRQVQKTLIEMIVREKRPVKTIARAVIDFMMAEREKTLGHKLSKDQITITKGLTKSLEEYKQKSVHIDIARAIRASGGEYYVGMKVPYIVTSSEKTLVAVHADDYQGQYDHVYYWDKVIYPPCYRILEVCFPEIPWHELFVKRKRPRKGGVVSPETAESESSPDSDDEE